jgi:ADP-dependent NAD(P)H-hydrate dehydratase
VLDAAAIGACRNLHEALHARAARLVLTPHLGEMAALTGREASWINDNSEALARETAAEFKAILVLKGPQTIIAGPDGTLLFYEGGGPGLATGGSGDVLAGIMGGLLARGADPMLAAAWAVWVHGQAGRTLTARYGGPGLLARELVDLVPELLHQA